MVARGHSPPQPPCPAGSCTGPPPPSCSPGAQVRAGWLHYEWPSWLYSEAWSIVLGWGLFHLLDGVEGLVVNVLHPVLLHQGSEHGLDGVHVIWEGRLGLENSRRGDL